MNNDLIYRDDAIEAILRQYPEPHYPDWYVDIIKKVGRTEYRPVFGAQWIDLPAEKYPFMCQCSSCGAEVQKKTPYCPYCGHDMLELIFISKDLEDDPVEG